MRQIIDQACTLAGVFTFCNRSLGPACKIAPNKVPNRGLKSLIKGGKIIKRAVFGPFVAEKEVEQIVFLDNLNGKDLKI